jgi:hypothetical protein
MADNVTLPGTGEVVLADELTDGTLGTGKVQYVKLMDGAVNGTSKASVGASGLAVDVQGSALTSLQLIDDIIKTDDAAFTPATDKVAMIGAQADETSPDSVDEGDAGALRMTLDRMLLVASRLKAFDISVDITRPADTTAYAAGDALSDSTSAPTSGGFTFAVARASGGSVLITDAYCYSSNDPATPLQCELFLFNQSVTNINDNAAFVVSDTEIKTLVADMQFALRDVGNNDMYHATNLGFVATCSGSANLRGLVRVLNAYTPASAEVITFRLRGFQLD